MQTMNDIEKGNYKAQSAAEHIAELKDELENEL